MVSVEKALETILNTAQDFGVEEIPFLQSQGRILKENILADRDFPPFNRVSMDGIAIDFEQFKNDQRTFLIEGIQAAGSEQISLKNPQNCLEVMTGAVLPNAANCVIRYEDVLIKNGMATVQIEAINYYQNIHQRGKDKKKGALLIAKNTKISAAEIAVLATVGKSTVNVAKHPKVMVISTGDELVGVAETPLPHQIRRSNVFSLLSLLASLQITADNAHLTDNKAILKATIKNYLDDYDVLLFSGAVSKGKFDFLPEIFEELSVQKLFHTVFQRPGKPFWFGQTATCKIFAFPGNPISTFVNCLVYFYPWLYKTIGIEMEQETAILAEDVAFKPALTYFLQVRLTNKNGQLFATPIQGNGSGDLASLVNANAFIQLPKDEVEFKSGAVFRIIRFR